MDHPGEQQVVLKGGKILVAARSLDGTGPEDDRRMVEGLPEPSPGLDLGRIGVDRTASADDLWVVLELE